MPHVDLTPRPDDSAKMPMPESLRPSGALEGPYQYTVASERPTGVAVIAFISFFIGLLLMIGDAGLYFEPSGSGDRAYWLILPILLAYVISLGAWQMYPWARMTAIVVYSFVSLAALFGAFLTPFTLGTVLAILVPALIVLYLFKKPVREAFERKLPLRDFPEGTDISP
ncbi:MAG TPA: hypothetical protein VLQ48_11200 [Chloroflexia bacterium]|nr:hypothetical protein [Chloroflexia bacterium]